MSRESLAHVRAVDVLVEKTPGVCGGAARIVRTRIPVWLLERYRQLGTSADELLAQFPSLRSFDLDAAFDYATRHSTEIADEIAANESA
ncbi:MAG: DUF433 domain-containing protein [Deltaproteobacteria bacterium]|nr:DUF433 domain-containing protein [Nannocystaceae bacterium]